MHDWRAEWKYQALFSCCTGRKVDVIILFKNNFAFHISRTYCGGSFIVCDITTNGKQLTLINVYAPNDDNPTFFNSVFEHLNSFSGDFDLIDVWRVQNPELRRFTWRQRNPEIHCRLFFS